MGSRSMPLLTSSSTCKTAPKWSMRGRAGGKDGMGGSNKVPGPGTYALMAPEKTRYARAPQAQFGTSLRDGVGIGGKAMPGPGQYTANFKANLEQTPKWGFGTSLRGGEGSTGRSRTPGPGAYDTRTDLGGTKVSMTARNMGILNRSLTPGPGTYGSNFNNLETAPRFGFGTSLRPDLSRPSKVPGPGTYAESNSMGQQCVTTSSPPKYSMKPRRNPVTHGNTTPGPSFIFTQFG